MTTRNRTFERTPNRKVPAPRGVFLPILLVVVGLALLAANLGWLSWEGFLRLAELWPLALVAVGADVLTSGRYRVLIVAAALVIVTFFYALGGSVLGLGGSAPSTTTVTQGLEGATRAQVRLTTGVAELRVDSGAGEGLLASGSIRTGRGERVEQSFRVEDGTAFLHLMSERAGPNFLLMTRSGAWNLTLTDAVPLTLDVGTGVGEAVLDLSTSRLERLALDTGVGAATVTLPGTGRYAVAVSSGVGAVTVRIPDGLAARVAVSRGVGAISVPSSFARDGDVYTSPGFDTASERVELRVTGGVGAITVMKSD